MTVSGISSANDVYQTNGQGAMSQRMADFRQLGSSLQSGDLEGAQKAYDALQQDMQSSGKTQGGLNSSKNNALQQLGDSLKAGDLAGAQKAFAALKQHHGHHHHRGGASTGNATDSSTVPVDGTQTQATGNNINVTV